MAAAVSRNCSNPNALPITIRTTIAAMSNIDTVSQTFDAEVHVKGKVHSSLDDIADDEFDSLDYTYFEMDFVNKVGELQVLYNPGLRRLPDEDAIVIEFRVVGTFSCEFKLYRFPYDSIECPIVITSNLPHKNGDGVLLLGRKREVALQTTKNEEGTSVVNFMTDGFRSSNLFKFMSTNVEERLSDPNISSAGSIYCNLVVKMFFLRESAWYWYNVTVPTGIFTLLTAGTFFVPHDEVADRLSVCLTMLLTTAAYKITVAAKLPEISYLTILDKYIFGCYLLQLFIPFVVLILSLERFYSSTFEIVIVGIWASLYVLGNICYFIMVRNARLASIRDGYLYS